MLKIGFILLLAIVFCIILYLVSWEARKLLAVDKNNKIYTAKSSISNELVAVCTSHKNVNIEIGETLKEYEMLLNRVGENMDKIDAELIKKLHQRRESMKTFLKDKMDKLNTKVEKNFSYLDKQYEQELGILKKIHTETIKNIDFINIDSWKKDVRIAGLYLSKYGDIAHLLTNLDSLLFAHNYRRIVNHRESLRKDEIKSQHIKGLLLAFITLFFYVTTVISLTKYIF